MAEDNNSGAEVIEKRDVTDLSGEGTDEAIDEMLDGGDDTSEPEG